MVVAGYTVYGSSRKGSEAGRGAFTLLRLDVTDDASVEAAVAELLQREGRIDLLINNAGYGLAPASALESSIEQAKALFDTNFLGIARLVRAVVPHMRSRRSGQIINISSILGVVPTPHVALYAASKHAVEGYSEALDHELRTDGIRVSVIEPAYTRTQFEANNVQPDEKLEEFDPLRQKLAHIVSQALETADGPEVVAECVLQAVNFTRQTLLVLENGS